MKYCFIMNKKIFRRHTAGCLYYRYANLGNLKIIFVQKYYFYNSYKSQHTYLPSSLLRSSDASTQNFNHAADNQILLPTIGIADAVCDYEQLFPPFHAPSFLVLSRGFFIFKANTLSNYSRWNARPATAAVAGAGSSF